MLRGSAQSGERPAQQVLNGVLSKLVDIAGGLGEKLYAVGCDLERDPAFSDKPKLVFRALKEISDLDLRRGYPMAKRRVHCSPPSSGEISPNRRASASALTSARANSGNLRTETDTPRGVGRSMPSVPVE